jgi:hypothetical protein
VGFTLYTRWDGEKDFHIGLGDFGWSSMPKLFDELRDVLRALLGDGAKFEVQSHRLVGHV